MRQYAGLMDLKDRGILYDLRRIHNLPDPTRNLLLGIATFVSRERKITLPRQEKRRRELLIGWLNLHYDKFKDLIPTLILYNRKESLNGPRMEDWPEYRAAIPNEDQSAADDSLRER
jgi:hypothetical protein